ncbi:MAG TPA: AmmeMemoRadiSam system protein A [Blastocatellia bacterium]|jgi:AmmeMemoRadiSam system protein A|nr:AmmeMemoRadiSam system protein A [Blastocatellia bacterium]
METLSKIIAPQDLARAAVERFIRDGVVIDPPARPEGILAQSAGAFVTIRTTGERLRGCIGTVSPSRETIAEEIIQNAISAATRDPRFPPVAPQELSHLTYGVDVLMPPEQARGIEDLDPSRYGVIIESQSGHRRGLLLPRIDGIETPEQQWRAVHQKAGINLGDPVRVERFMVTRFGKD